MTLRPRPHLESLPGPDVIGPLLEELVEWARSRADVLALALVGSHARGTPRADSDMDLVLLTSRPERYIESDGWAREIGGRVILTRAWGAVTERRLKLDSGMELDVAVADRQWAAADPVDQGTLRVLRDGISILHDPERLLEALVR